MLKCNLSFAVNNCITVICQLEKPYATIYCTHVYNLLCTPVPETPDAMSRVDLVSHPHDVCQHRDGVPIFMHKIVLDLSIEGPFLKVNRHVCSSSIAVNE